MKSDSPGGTRKSTRGVIRCGGGWILGILGPGVLQIIAGPWVNNGGRTSLFDGYSWAHVYSVVVDDT